ncbi:MAG: tRNA lysidine(34) synthetase TilS [Flavobacteriales bacterium]|nr:tRNA lysidine(34) synthetase TilS [Flavobacteriales bacterium]MCB9191032.1 tRNA lysidine(34) synthetase TilS [Flavobacteriales bacterium]MCB9203379.1 tRNA lysidine(34) synthetase TilS [Flavobacteriales bacterium]
MQKLGFPINGRTILVAVSGGADSMVLASLLSGSGYNIAIAHCNYQLREAESDADEALVKAWCAERNVPFHLKKVDTKKLARGSNASIQMIARNERYKFFQELIGVHGYCAVALAHHANDRVESLLLNVLRGTGIKGFQGMPSKRGNSIRPLLDFKKEEIVDFARARQVPFREDASNADTYYKRNWVRLKVLPLLEAYDPNAISKLLAFCQRVETELPNYQKWARNEVSKLREDDRVFIQQLNRSKTPFTLLREMLKPFGFNSDLIHEVMDILSSDPGAEVRSETHRVVKDREQLVITSLSETDREPNLAFQTISRNELETLKTDAQVALIDADGLDEKHLKLRKWQQGDRFKPLGMDRWKLLSDYFIDEKFSIPQKESTWLLTMNDEIVWVVGHRLDNRFKVQPNTQKVLKVSLLD